MSIRRDVPLVAWVVAAILLAAHLLTLTQYGVFRDELYYVANGRHLAWGYVDHPPMVAAIAWLTKHTLGTSVVALRVPMLLALCATLAVIAALVRRLGGGPTAIVVAWTAFALAPHYLFIFHVLSMNAPEVLLWALAALLLLRATEDEPDAASRTAWLLFGVVMGAAALTKVSGFVWGAGLAAALLLSPARRHLRTPWPWVAVVISGAMFAPHVWWQMSNGWPTSEFVRNAQATKITPLSGVEFLASQVTLVGPLGVVVAACGLVASLTRRVRGGRAWAIAAAVTLVAFLAQRSKAYYFTPVYPVLLAAGGVMLERWAPWRRWPGRAVAAVLVLVSLALVPVALPVLPVEKLPAYLSAIGISIQSGERHEMGVLPQHFADMTGWDTLAQDVAQVVATLTPEERARARVYAQNYGEAGAIDYFGPSLDLPPAISGHNAYWHWGPGPSGDVLVIIGGNTEDHRRVFADVREAGRTTCTTCMPYEANRPIFVARQPRASLADAWARVRHYN